MDRNSAIGLTLIAALLMVYFLWFAPKPDPNEKKVATEQTTQPAKTDSLATSSTVTTQTDSALAAQFGDLSAVLKGDETTTVVETEDIKASFSGKGGVIKELELKKFKTYSQEPLKLITPNSNTFALRTNYKGKDIDLYSLYYQASQQKTGDTTFVTFTAKLADGSGVTQTYAIPDRGYEIGYKIASKGLEFAGENLSLEWTNIVRPVEKDLKDTRDHTTITYYTASEGFDKLSEGSVEKETETLGADTKWVAVKEKFFLTSLIAKESFAGAVIETSVNVADSSVVKRAKLNLSIPKKALAENKGNFKFYIGPNDYQVIGDVTVDFAKNVYLGWPPVYWINKFVIFPVFHLLTQFISNYGLIIIILVILLKLVLAPLSYKSYLSMAKMKVLKPELDEIKARVGDDMQKAQQEQMKLYQQVGVNPISGCIPVLLQMPILFAMFYLFPASIELRQQSFLWAEDLSTYDSVIRFSYLWPLGDHISLFTVLMTLATLAYTWQNNQISSVQGPMKAMSYIMPVIFFFVLNSFSAGLTFYYFVSTMATFIQQAIIRRFVDDGKIRALLEENRKKIAAGGGSKSKFMSKLQEAMKASEEARKKADEERRKKKK